MSFEADVSRLTRRLGLPKLTRLSGLKEAHARFDEVSKKLNTAYVTARRRNDMATTSAVATCSPRLHVHPVSLGILVHILELISLPISPVLTFRLLALVTYYGDESVQLKAARHGGWVLLNVRNRFHDNLAVEYGLAVLAHCTEAASAALGSPSRSKSVMLTTSMQDLVTVSVDALRKSSLTHNMATHALALLVIVAGSDYFPEVKFPSGLFVALLKTGDPSIHTAAFAIAIKHGMLTTPKVLMEGMLNAPPIHPPPSFPDIVSSTFPSDIRNLLSDFGIEKCETFRRKMVEDELDLCLMTLNTDRDIYTFGCMVAETIPFISLLDRARPRVKELLRLTMNVLPRAAQALRDLGDTEATERADTIQLFYFNETLPSTQVSSFAKQVIARNCSHTYAFILKAQHDGGDENIPMDKTNPGHVHLFRKLSVATAHLQQAGGWGQLRSLDPTYHDIINDGVRCCRDAVEIAENYLKTAPPPDTLDLPFILETIMVCKLLDKGVASDDDLDEIRDLVARHELSVRTLKALGYTVTFRPIRAAFDYILRTHQESTREWGRIALHIAALARTAHVATKPPQAVAPGIQEEVFTRLCLQAKRGSPNSGAFKCACGDGEAVHPDAADLNKCSWCGTCSAVLRKCARCQGAFYCNANCQKSHWSMHKPECKSRSS